MCEDWIRTRLNGIQMSLNKKCAFERSKNVDIFGGASVNRETIIDKVLRSTRSRKRHGEILQV